MTSGSAAESRSPYTVTSSGTLDSPVREAIARLGQECHRVDGHHPLNEEARLTVADGGIRDGIAHLLVRRGERLVGYAMVDSATAPPVMQLMIAPNERRQGAGWQVLAAIGFDPRPQATAAEGERAHQGQELTLWSFGALPAARAWAEKYQAPAIRQLLVMARNASDIPTAQIPEGYTLRPFQESDLEELLRVNAAAFAHHPEQGRMSADDVRARMAEPWFDPNGFLVVEHQGRVAGFHWTKQHSPKLGEVYIIGVHPDHSGRGLGRQLLHAGMQYLAEQGVDEIILYVEGDQRYVVEMYQKSHFVITNTDLLYRWPSAVDRR